MKHLEQSSVDIDDEILAEILEVSDYGTIFMKFPCNFCSYCYEFN